MDLQKKLDFMEGYRLALPYRKHREPAITYEWISRIPFKEQGKESAYETDRHNG